MKNAGTSVVLGILYRCRAVTIPHVRVDAVSRSFARRCFKSMRRGWMGTHDPSSALWARARRCPGGANRLSVSWVRSRRRSVSEANDSSAWTPRSTLSLCRAEKFPFRSHNRLNRVWDAMRALLIVPMQGAPLCDAKRRGVLPMPEEGEPVLCPLRIPVTVACSAS